MSVIVPVKRFGRSIYASTDGRYIAIVPSNAKAIETWIPDGNKWRTVKLYKTVKLGDFYGWVEPVKSIGIGTADREAKASGVAELIYYMYKAGEVTDELPISPLAKLYVSYDGRKLADTAIDLYDVAAEESIISIAAIAGKLREFKEFVKLKMEMEEKEVEKTISKGIIIIVILFVIGLIAMLVGGH